MQFSEQARDSCRRYGCWPRVATGRPSSRIAREVTTEVGFGFTPLILRRALKPLFSMRLRRSNHTLFMSTVALFCAFFSRGSTASPLNGGFVLHLFLPRIDRISTGSEQLTPNPATATDKIIRGFDTFKHLRTTVAFAAAGQSHTINTIDPLIVISATTPPQQRPLQPPSHTESELPRSRGDTPPT
jgi:hypothetical protein